ncbi:MAG: hypothetical protein JWM82_1457 [Myxococcales bacterium]|nr:hypothetical protein [Myxococcales bacterium]
MIEGSMSHARRSGASPLRWIARALFGAALLLGCGRAAQKAKGDASVDAMGAAGAADTADTTGGAGTADTAGTTGTAGAVETAGTTGAAGAAAAGTTGTGGEGPAGVGGTAGAGAGGAGGSRRSAGCMKLVPTGTVPGTFATHIVNIAGLDPIYLPGGALSQTSGPFDFSHRPYSVRLPTPYDETQAHTVIFSGGSCGESAQTFAANPNGGYVVDPKHANIEVGLSSVGPCFADGGPSIDDRDDTPDVPYFRAALAEVEAQLCVDTSKVFVTGYSSGAWEAQTLGCAAGDVITGVATIGGDLRAHRPKCKGPVPTLLIVSTVSPDTQLGPLDHADPNFIRLDSPGALPTRDEVLVRNGCASTTSQPFDPHFPLCATFTGCPAAAPVVWCHLTAQGINIYAGYSPGPMLQFLSSLP